MKTSTILLLGGTVVALYLISKTSSASGNVANVNHNSLNYKAGYTAGYAQAIGGYNQTTPQQASYGLVNF